MALDRRILLLAICCAWFPSLTTARLPNLVKQQNVPMLKSRGFNFPNLKCDGLDRALLENRREAARKHALQLGYRADDFARGIKGCGRRDIKYYDDILALRGSK